jgi:hypothetical protein
MPLMLRWHCSKWMYYISCSMAKTTVRDPMLFTSWMLEHGGSSAPGGCEPPDRKKFETTYRSFPLLAQPVDHGVFTIADLYGVTDADEYVRLVRAWAESVWAAWSKDHAWAREMAGCLLAH